MGPPPKRQETKKEIPKPTGEAKRKPKEATPLENAKTHQEIMAERRLQELRNKVRKQVSAAVIQYPFVGRNMKFEVDEDRIFLRIFSDGRFLFRRPAAGPTATMPAAPPESVLMDTFEGVMRNFKEWEEYLEGVTDADSTTAEIDLQAMLKVTEAWPKSWTYSLEDFEVAPPTTATTPNLTLRRARTLQVKEATHVIHFAIVPFFKPEYAVLSEDESAVLGPRKGSRVPPRRLQMGLTVASVAGEEPESSVWLPCTGADAVFPGPSKQKKASPPRGRLASLGQSMSMGALETVAEGLSSGKSPTSFGLSTPGLPRLKVPFEGQTAGLGTSTTSSMLARTQSGCSPIQRRLGEKRRQFFGGLTAYEETRQKGQFLSTVIDSLRPEVHPSNQLLRKTFSAPKDLSEQLTILRPLDASRGPGGDVKGKKGGRNQLSQEAWSGMQSFGSPQHRPNPRAALVGQSQIQGTSLPNFGTIGGGGGGRGSLGAIQSSYDASRSKLPGGNSNDWSAFYKSRSQEFLRRLSNA